jgi:tetratricopeptide (TPR) repeat protein
MSINIIIRLFLIVAGLNLLGACRPDPVPQALQALERGDLTRAKLLLQRDSEINPGEPSAFANLGIVQLRLGHTNEALSAFRQASSLALDDPRPLEFMAAVAADQGQWKTAAGYLADAVRRAPQSPRIHNALAVAELETLGPQAAQKRLDAVLGIAPNYSPAVFNLAMLNRYWLNNQPEAKTLFQQYIKLSSDPERQALARRALADIEKAPRLPPPPLAGVRDAAPPPSVTPAAPRVVRQPQAAAEAYNQGVRAHASGNLDRALQEYSRAVQNDPTMANAHYNLGLVFRARNDLAKARSALQQALTLSPDMADARYMLALVLRDLHESEAALTELKALLDKHPQYAPAYHALGQIHKESPARLNLAKQAFRRYLELAPNGPSAREARNWLNLNP